MGWFAVRVELHQLDNQRQPTWDDYSRLHVAMQQRGYLRIIKGSDDKWYHLPTQTILRGSTTKTWQQYGPKWER